MPREPSVPKYLHHKATGQAYCRIGGKNKYLGKWQSPQSKTKYEQVCRDWAISTDPTKCAVTVADIAVRYSVFVRTYYLKDGDPTSEVKNTKYALKALVEICGTMSASAFGPKALKLVRQHFINRELARSTINAYIGKIRRAFKWAVEEELIAGGVLHALRAVSALKKGRSLAKEMPKVLPVAEPDVFALEPHCSPTVWAMIRIQRLTGMRSGELVVMRTADIDRTYDVWLYIPGRHKTEHHEKTRVIAIGPKAQEILLPYLDDAAPEKIIFVPKRAYTDSSESADEHRLKALLRARKLRKSVKWYNPPKDHFTSQSFWQAIRYACQKAGISHWHPHRLRHSAATELRKKIDLDTARAVLGHGTISMAEIYAERDIQAAMDAMRRFG